MPKKKTISENEEAVSEAMTEIAEDENITEDVEKDLEGKGEEKSKKKEAEIIIPKETQGILDIDEKRKALLEKAAKLKGKIETVVSEELKEKVKVKKKEDTLLPLEDYVKSGIYIGTKVVTPDMRKYVYRRRADGLAILNTDIIDKKIKDGIKYLSEFGPEKVIVVCKRQAGWRAVRLFSEITGIRVFTKKYPAGILTNTQLPDFFEIDLVVICDPWLDKNALNDAIKVNTNIMTIADTNNFTKYANQVIIGNNKSARSLGLIFYLLAKGYLNARKIEKKIPELEFWEIDEEEAQKMKISGKTSEKIFEKKKIKEKVKDLEKKEIKSGDVEEIKDNKEERVDAIYGV